MADENEVLEPDTETELPPNVTQEVYDAYLATSPNPNWKPRFSADGKFVGYQDEYGQILSFYGDTQTQPQYFPPPREASDNSRFSDGKWAFAPDDWRGYGTYTFTGEGIIDADGNIVLTDDQGKPRSYMYEDALSEFYAMGDDEREKLLDDLEQIGLPVDTAMNATASFWKVMDYSNGRGYSWQTVLADLQANTPRQDLEDAPKYYVTPKATISDTANKVALETLGREFTAEELDRFVKSYNDAELSYQQQESGVATLQPGISAAAGEFAQEQAPKEADAYAYLGRMNTFIDSLGAL